MARAGWGGSTAAALGVAAGAGAAQLGFGYGLGIINWAPTGSVRVEAAWVASLAWATWIAATSVIAGAVCAQRLRAGDEPTGALPRLGLALAAGVGALVTVLLVAVPARAARVPDTSAPQTVAAAYAAAGLALGVLLATWALHTRAAATNLIATTGWLWLLAVVSVVDSVLSGRGLTTAQLGIWQISADRAGFWIRDYFYWPGAVLSLGSALVIGVLAARRAARSPQVRVGAAASGAAGPLLVALAYLLAVPRLAGIAAEQLSAHLIAPYAVIAGVGGSLLVAALAQRADRRAAEPGPPHQTPGEVTGRLDEPAHVTATGPESTTPDAPGPATGEPTPTSDEPTPTSDEFKPAPDEPESATVGPGPADESEAVADKPGATVGRVGRGAAGASTSKERGTRTAAGRTRSAVPVQRQPEVSSQPTPVDRDGPASVDGRGPAPAHRRDGQSAADALTNDGPTGDMPAGDAAAIPQTGASPATAPKPRRRPSR
ncbi:hypothetical protein [Micromonospora sp. NBS 11-29]|uniref:hypothetical protein n=1 Tax=Micromonospora sp. NBS 11-29 TaxID=1960879 RepID=UPI0020CD82FC|nr:hypothetical protein [Micromonospora sp. NBS 11-29]